MNETIHCSRTISAWGWKMCAVLGLGYCMGVDSVSAQPPQPAVPAYGGYGYGAGMEGPPPQYPIPNRPQYYEYLPPDRFGEENIETPLDRFLKQSIKQTYGRFDYINWDYSSPGSGIVGAPGKKLTAGEGTRVGSFIDHDRAEVIINDTNIWPLRTPRMYHDQRNLVLIQTWESTQSELIDTDTDGNLWEAGDTNDIDIFPRLTVGGKSSLLSNPADANGIMFSTGLPGDPAQVAVLAVGQLLDANAFSLDGANGFRGVVGLNTSFGALETQFLYLGRATSTFVFNEIPSGLLTIGGGAGAGGGGIDPMVIPILVNGQMAPNVYDTFGNLVTDSNNYYLVYNVNQGYRAHLESESWGFAPSILWTMEERPGLFKFSSKLGFRYFDMRERFSQYGTFSNNPAQATIEYDNVLGSSDLQSSIISSTTNLIYGPQAGFRAELGDERFALGVDANFLLGANTHNAVVAANDILFTGDNNYTKHSSTYLATGLELLVDAKLRISNHVSLTFGYNLLWFGNVTRPVDNVYYNINATQKTDPPDTDTWDYNFENDIRVNKKRTNVNMRGFSAGIMVDW